MGVSTNAYREDVSWTLESWRTYSLHAVETMIDVMPTQWERFND